MKSTRETNSRTVGKRQEPVTEAAAVCAGVSALLAVAAHVSPVTLSVAVPSVFVMYEAGLTSPELVICLPFIQPGP